MANLADSISVLRGVLKDAPENARAHYFLAQAMRQSGDMVGAKGEIQEAVKREPDNRLYVEAQAEIYRDAGDYENAENYATRLLKLAPKSPQAHLTMATIQLGPRTTRRLTKISRQPVGAKRSCGPPEHGVLLRRTEKYAEAEREFQTASRSIRSMISPPPTT